MHDDGKRSPGNLPDAVEADLQRFQNAENVAPRDPFVELTERGVRAVVTRTAEETGDDNFRHVSSHDLRRRFAQRLFVDENMNPRCGHAGRWVGQFPGG